MIDYAYDAPAVSVSGLTKHFGRVRAVDDVTLDIPQGSVYGLLGPNGSGKTTLLSMLMGFLRPTAGAITLLGQSGPAGHRAALARTGALIERPTFWPYLSCRDNLRCLQGVYATGGAADPIDRLPDTVSLGVADEIDRLLDTVGLDGAASGRKFAACSTGMKQRLGIAATLLGNPTLLILDEPTNGLDPAGLVEIRELIRTLAADGPRTIILASHLLNEVEQVCDRVGVMARGRLLYSGPVAEMGAPAQVRVQIRTTDDHRAADLLRQAGWEIAAPSASPSPSAAGLEIAAPPGREWEITRDRANAGIYITAMQPTGGGLEAWFMEVTGESDRD